eukprot:jgi/Botrbrau1/13665/Bobra.0292s0014.1
MLLPQTLRNPEKDCIWRAEFSLQSFDGEEALIHVVVDGLIPGEVPVYGGLHLREKHISGFKLYLSGFGTVSALFSYVTL